MGACQEKMQGSCETTCIHPLLPIWGLHKGMTREVIPENYRGNYYFTGRERTAR